MLEKSEEGVRMFRELVEGRCGFWTKLWAAAAPLADSPFHMSVCTSNETEETGRRKHAAGRKKHATGRRKCAARSRKQSGRKHAAVMMARSARARAGGPVATKRSHFRDEVTEAGLR